MYAKDQSHILHFRIPMGNLKFFFYDPFWPRTFNIFFDLCEIVDQFNKDFLEENEFFNFSNLKKTFLHYSNDSLNQLSCGYNFIILPM